METRFKLLSSLEKVFFDLPEEMPELESGSMLKNLLLPAGWLDRGKRKGQGRRQTHGGVPLGGVYHCAKGGLCTCYHPHRLL